MMQLCHTALGSVARTPTFTALLVLLVVGGSEATESSFPVRCSRSCNGLDTCVQMCAGEMKQTGKCPAMKPCPKPEENPALCPSGPENCQFGPWTSWKNDTAACSGLCMRSRSIAQVNRCGGAACSGPLTDTKLCTGNCDLIVPKDCTFSDWSLWGACSADKKNQRQRSREVKEKPVQGGVCTGSLAETQVCAPAVSGANCVVSAWMPWNECSKTCGGGQYIRFRTIAQRATSGGVGCSDSISETAPCNVGVSCEAPADCLFSQWGEWLAVLGGGVQKTRTRTVQNAATGAGKVCSGKLQETQAAAQQPASTPVDCKLSDWSTWGSCDKTCGGGQTYRQRTIVSEAQNGGTACGGDMKETQECNTATCSGSTQDLDCKFATWSDWGTCSASCGVGMQSRKRQVWKQAQPGGLACSGPMETLQTCKNAVSCATENCMWGLWSAWSACPVTCGESHKRRARRPTPASPGGKACLSEDMEEVERCGKDKCPLRCTNGEWNLWGEWSVCTKSCSGGYRTHKRSLKTFANSCGKNATGVDTEAESCNADVKCAGDEDCQLSEWSPWSAYMSEKTSLALASCGSVEWRTRDLKVHGTGHGKYCGTSAEGDSLSEVQMSPGFIYGAKCNITKKTDCEWGLWGAWGTCSSTCEGGAAKRDRKVAVQPSRTGKACEGALVENEPCNAETPCSAKVDCTWAAWAEWSACTKCSGQKIRTRAVEILPVGGGRICAEDASKQVKRCPKNCGKFTNYFCIWSIWSPWGECDMACGNSTRSRKMVLGATEEQPADGNYAALAYTKGQCSGERIEKSNCKSKPCGPCVPKDCILGAWLGWSQPTCEGVCTRTRAYKQQQNTCGKPCIGSINGTKTCLGTMAACEKKNCQLSSWAEWSPCHSTLGQKYRSRGVRQHPRGDGQPCINNLNETAPCMQQADAVSCKLEDWAAWGTCTKSCGGGHHVRQRKVLQESSHGGEACSGLTVEASPCNVDKCVSVSHRDCALASWGPWTTCNSTTETQSFRWRHVMESAIGSGMPCVGHLQETQSCAEAGPVNCKFSEWTAWGACSTTCYGGQQQRSRSIEDQAVRGGKTCLGKMIMMRSCAGAEPGNCKGAACVLSDWQNWTPCSPSCGDGQKERRRIVKVPPGPGGAACPSVLAEVSSCQNDACPGNLDCKWQDWADWQPCVKAQGACGVGYKRRMRDILTMPVGAGRQCPPRIKEELMPVTGCDGQMECCIDAMWAEWAAWSTCGVTCGGGTATRTRILGRKETWCGKPAAGSSIEYRPCNPDACGYQNCLLSQWTAWLPKDACPLKCSEGHAERTRKIEKHAHHGGEPCLGSTHELERCPHETDKRYTDSCKSYIPTTRDCVVSTWSEWSACSQTCAKGYKEHSRVIEVPPMYNGSACPSSLRELALCNEDIPCSATSPVACAWNTWTEWAACENEEQTSSRGYAVEEVNGGASCAGPKIKVRPCGVCANSTYSCGWGEWADWEPCTATCGTGGSRSRLRTLKTGEEPIMNELYDSTVPKLKIPSEEDAPEGRHVQDLMSAIALGCTSLAIALAARTICVRRRGLPEDAESCRARARGAYEPVDTRATQELLLEDSLE